jgi:hypothetical protein
MRQRLALVAARAMRAVRVPWLAAVGVGAALQCAAPTTRAGQGSRRLAPSSTMRTTRLSDHLPAAALPAVAWPPIMHHWPEGGNRRGR